MKRTTANILRLVFLSLCIIAELGYILFTITSLFLFACDPEPPMPVSAMVTMLVHSELFLCISIGGIVRTAKARTPILISGSVMKLTLTFFALGVIYIGMEIGVAAVFMFVLGAVTFIPMILLLRPSRRKDTPRTSANLDLLRFSASKAKWAWDDAAAEYCAVNRITADRLNDDDNRRIYDYAAAPIAYFMAWLIKNDALCMREDIAQELDAIKNERANPVDVFGAHFDYVLSRDDICTFMHPFVNSYYHHSHSSFTVVRSLYSVKYWDEYREVVRNNRGLVYCLDFSWDTYHALEQKINERYEYFKRGRCMYFSEDFIDFGTVDCPFADTKLTVEAERGVSTEYVELCKNHINSLSDYTIDSLCCVLDNFFYDYGFAPKNKRDALAHLSPDSMTVYLPHGEEPAYILGCESDLEEEHGISVVIRGDEIIQTEYRCDADSPWSFENELAYKIACEIRAVCPEAVDSAEKAEKLTEQGLLCRIDTDHAEFGGVGTANGREFVPPTAAAIKARCDSIIENLFRDGSVDKYTCTAIYKDGSIIPRALDIVAKKGEKRLFSQRINIR